MELKLLLSFAASLLGGVFGHGLQSHDQAPPKPPVALIEHKLQVPAFLVNIPHGHFAGISPPCNTLSDARKCSIDDVARQILSAVNAEYTHHYLDRVSGNIRDPVRKVDDRLLKFAKGVVLGIEQGIVKSSWSKDASGRYIYFILVMYSDKNISEMRRLSKGAKVIGRVLQAGNTRVEIRVTEVNGVAVTVSSIDVTVRKANRYANFISYYIWKVSKGSVAKFSQAVAPVEICKSSTTVTIKLPSHEKRFSDYLLGTDLNVQGVIKGTDEIGRGVEVKVDL